MPKKIFWVEVPQVSTIDGEEAAWLNVGTFDTREEAIKFIQDNIDGSSTDGKVNLISEGQDLD